MKKVLIALVIILVIAVVLMIMLMHYSSNQIMDKEGMIHPDFRPGSTQPDEDDRPGDGVTGGEDGLPGDGVTGGEDGLPGDGVTGGEDAQMCDGNYTYVDNEALLKIISGSWQDREGQYVLEIEEDYAMTIHRNGNLILKDILHFTYLQPGPALETELTLNQQELKLEDGTLLGEIAAFYYLPGEGRGSILLEVLTGEDNEEVIRFE